MKTLNTKKILGGFLEATVATALFLVLGSCGLNDEPVNNSAPGVNYNGQRLRKAGETLFLYYADVTGIPQSQANVAQEYENVKFSLPTDTNPEATTTSMFTAAVTLAARFCDRIWESERVIADPALRRHYKNVPFTQGPTVFSAAQRAEAMRSLATAAWHRAPTEAEMQKISARIQEVAAAGANNSNTTRAMMLVGCTAILTSYDALKL